MSSDIPEHICKRISKAGENPICRGQCDDCPCVTLVRGACKQLSITPDASQSFTHLPPELFELLTARADEIWQIFGAGGELHEDSQLDDGCGHEQIHFFRPLPPGFLDVGPEDL